MLLDLEQAAGDFHLPDERPERILLISGGSGITPVMSMLRTLCARGPSGPGHVPALRARPRARDLPGRARADRRGPSQCSPRSLVHARAGAGGGGWPLQPGAAHPSMRARLRARRNLRLRPAGASRCRPRARGRPTAWSRACTSRASFLRRWRRRAASPRARSTSPAPTLRLDNSGASLLEQAEGAGLTPRPDAAWASATRAAAARRAGTVKNLATGEVSSAEDEEIQICVSAPIGDVVVEL